MKLITEKGVKHQYRLKLLSSALLFEDAIKLIIIRDCKAFTVEEFFKVYIKPVKNFDNLNVWLKTFSALNWKDALAIEPNTKLLKFLDALSIGNFHQVLKDMSRSKFRINLSPTLEYSHADLISATHIISRVRNTLAHTNRRLKEKIKNLDIPFKSGDIDAGKFTLLAKDELYKVFYKK